MAASKREPLRAFWIDLLFLLPLGQWLVQSEFALVMLTLSPLLFIAAKRGAASGYVYAGVCSVLLGIADLIHPLGNVGSHAASSPHRVLFLAIIAFILFRLRDAYFGLKELSERDPLTGLLNRRGFEEQAQRELARAARYHRPIAFAVIDIDRFKEVNDRYGHARGDELLRVVGEELTRLRASDLAVRLGGDEFGLLMPETDEAAAARVVDRLKQRVNERMHEENWPVTISVGSATAMPTATRLTTLMEEADRRMYAEKRSARDARDRKSWQECDAPGT
ncbi:MAG TPA: GGDEF domain-containing protein [Polyangiales bacterium]|nr:GGDEF domain-containing protein [Polyangiales bacterium]